MTAGLSEGEPAIAPAPPLVVPHATIQEISVNRDETGTQLGCTETECTNVLLIPDKKSSSFNAFVYKSGWAIRGSTKGMQYFCLQHLPNFGGVKKKKEEHMNHTDDELMRVPAIAARLKVSKMTVYRLIHAGQLPAVRIGSTYRVFTSVVDTYLESSVYTPDAIE